MLDRSIRCTACGYGCDEHDLACGMCGAPLRAPPPPVPHDCGPAPSELVFDEPVEAPICGLPRFLFFFLVGVPAALLCVSGAFGARYSWFLAALFHEFGHTLAGLLLGAPSFPAISLAGHAATVHQEQMTFMAVAIQLALVGGVVWLWRGGARERAIALGLAAAIYPLLAFVEPAREAVFLLGGHLGELAFATLCLARAWTGGFTHHSLERGAYSMVGWLLVGRNVGLCWGLATSAAARAEYRGNGSFGLTNDYVRLAEDVWGWSLPQVAVLMLVVALLVPALAAGAGWLRGRAGG